MKTYSETRGKKPFNWHEYLNKPLISFDEWLDAKHRAGSWVTCAVGNACAIIPRLSEGEPVNDELRRLGERFMNEIDNKYHLSAKTTLEKIEIKSKELIQIEVEDAKRIIKQKQALLRFVAKKKSIKKSTKKTKNDK